LAGNALANRLPRGRAPRIDLRGLPAPLQSIAAAFVTLTRDGPLRRCIGALVARRALARDIAANAVRAGFDDPRFHPLAAPELANTEIEISVLSAAAPMPVRDEADLLAQLRPGRDGLILQEGERRATFLPKVWDQLPAPPDFLGHLKHKAGLAPGHWSADVRVWRYVAESFKGRIGPAA